MKGAAIFKGGFASLQYVIFGMEFAMLADLTLGSVQTYYYYDIVTHLAEVYNIWQSSTM